MSRKGKNNGQVEKLIVGSCILIIFLIGLLMTIFGRYDISPVFGKYARRSPTQEINGPQIMGIVALIGIIFLFTGRSNDNPPK